MINEHHETAAGPDEGPEGAILEPIGAWEIGAMPKRGVLIFRAQSREELAAQSNDASRLVYYAFSPEQAERLRDNLEQALAELAMAELRATAPRRNLQ